MKCECPSRDVEDKAHVWTYKTEGHLLNRVIAFCAGSVQRAVVFHQGNTLWGYVKYRQGKPYLQPDCAAVEIPLFTQ